MKSKQSGFTIIEVIISVTLLAILAGIAVPSFQRIIHDYSVTTQANDVLVALNVARSEAVKRGGTVYFVAKSGNDFSSGWCVSTTKECSSGVIRQAETVKQLKLAPSVALEFDSLGRKRQPSGTEAVFAFEPADCEAGHARAKHLQVLDSGSASISRKNCG